MTHQVGQLGEGGANPGANDDDPELRAVVRQGIEAALERGDVVRVGIDGEVGPPTSLCGAVDTAPTPTIPDGLCGFFIGDRDGGTGACVFLPHPLGTPHSWAPNRINPAGIPVKYTDPRAGERRVSWRGRD